MRELVPFTVTTQMILILGFKLLGIQMVMVGQGTDTKSARVDPLLLKKTQIHE